MERLLSQKSFTVPYVRVNSREVSRQSSQKWSTTANSSVKTYCKSMLVGFLCGALVMYLCFFVSTTPNISSYVFQIQASRLNIYGSNPSRDENGISSVVGKEQNRVEYNGKKEYDSFVDTKEKDKASLLYALWEEHLLSPQNVKTERNRVESVTESVVPRAPHIQDCEALTKAYEKLDRRGENGSRPSWSIWKGHLGLKFGNSKIQVDNDEEMLFENRTTRHGPLPPWIEGGDEDNLPLTRRVQRDLWLHQHPRSCSDPKLKFLLTDWETNPGFGLGAQIAGMAGMLALAFNQNRILVTNYFNRADHEGCKGSGRSQWSCYFLPETSLECRQRALELAKQESSWMRGVVTNKGNYTTKEIWVGKIPRHWGKPWEAMQPTTEIDGKLLKNHRSRDRRWWRAQAVRYLMRFQTKYSCELMNIARHKAFGMEAAKMVSHTLPAEWPKIGEIMPASEIVQYVWTVHKPWVPRPLLSIHVRLGDKVSEMKMVNFEGYMKLAQHIRSYFPHVKNIWLSTEMQEVIDQSKSYKEWNFYYTAVKRQEGNMTMPAYEASLGRETSTNYPLVNFLMAADADVFVGALGSTWCFLIDGMRATGGKVIAGYLSVNKDRFW